MELADGAGLYIKVGKAVHRPLLAGGPELGLTLMSPEISSLYFQSPHSHLPRTLPHYPSVVSATGSRSLRKRQWGRTTNGARGIPLGLTSICFEEDAVVAIFTSLLVSPQLESTDSFAYSSRVYDVLVFE